MSLGIKVDEKNPLAKDRKTVSQVYRRGGFSDASLLIDDGNDITFHRHFPP